MALDPRFAALGAKLLPDGRIWVPSRINPDTGRDMALEGVLGGEGDMVFEWLPPQGTYRSMDAVRNALDFGDGNFDPSQFTVSAPTPMDGGFVLPTGASLQARQMMPNDESVWEGFAPLAAMAAPAFLSGIPLDFLGGQTISGALSSTLGNVGSGALTGGLVSAVTGGDPIRGALTGGAFGAAGDYLPSFDTVTAPKGELYADASNVMGTMTDAPVYDVPADFGDITNPAGGLRLTDAGMGLRATVPDSLSLSGFQPASGPAFSTPSTAAMGALAPGFFAAENLTAPLTNTTVSPEVLTESGLGTLAKVGGGALTLSKLLGLSGDGASAVDALGRAIPGLIGAYAASQQGDAYEDLISADNARYQQNLALGAPSRARYEASFAPGFDVSTIPGLQGAMDTTTDTLLRRLSAEGGNPWGNPGGLAEVNKYVLGNVALPALSDYRRLNANAGGLTRFSDAAASGPNMNLASAGIGADSNVWGGLGDAAASVFTPKTSLADLLKQFSLA